MGKIDRDHLAKALGAKPLSIPEITKEESEKYEQLGSPVMVPLGDMLDVYHYGSRMLINYNKSIEEVVGYRITGLDEEKEFRQECGNIYGTVVLYYGRKSEE